MRKISKKSSSAVVFALLIICAASLSQAEYLKYSVKKSSYQVGENVGVDIEVTNPTNEEKTFTCVVTFDPPTSKNPSCSTKDIRLKPGEKFEGFLGQIAEIPANSKMTIKLVDQDNPEAILENYTLDLRVTSSKEPECGDLICEPPENYTNCQEDCHGEEDGVCDDSPDGVCDPDCMRQGTPEKDPDCVCTKDGVCGKGENYANCPSDCASGSSDGYCDSIKDGVCDPDCAGGEDPDCGGAVSAYMGYVPYAALLVIIALAFFSYRIIENRKIAKQRDEFRKWKEEREK